MKKKLISLMLVGAMAFSMTACGLSKADLYQQLLDFAK